MIRLIAGFLTICMCYTAPTAFGEQPADKGPQIQVAADRVAAAAAQLKADATAVVGRSTPQSLATLQRSVAATEAELEYIISNSAKLIHGDRAKDLEQLKLLLSDLKKQKESLTKLLKDKQEAKQSRDDIARRLGTIGDQTFRIAQSMASRLPPSGRRAR